MAIKFSKDDERKREREIYQCVTLGWLPDNIGILVHITKLGLHITSYVKFKIEC